MAHNHACANARKPGCECSGCGGSLHGWPGHLGLSNDSPEERVSRRTDAEQEWYRAVGGGEEDWSRRLSAPTREMLGRAVDVARVDIAEHLAARPATVARIREFGGLIRTRALHEVKVEAGRGLPGHLEPARIDRALPGHFWCSLLTALVGATDRVDRAVDKVPDQAREILSQDQPPDWGPTRELVADTALEAVWGCAAGFLGVWRPEELLLVMRVLAVFICPDPGTHPDLVRTCLLPLRRGVLQESALRLLHQSLPQHQSV